MNINSQSAYYPAQPDNPSDQERHFLLQHALAEKGRSEDFGFIKKNMSPPPDITHYAKPGSFKGIKVGIIGGGLAGLSAAFELRKLGFDIAVYEALEDRAGGRVFTYYFDKEKKYYGEFGPMRIPVSHEAVWHYLKLFRLPTRPFIQYNSNTFVYLNKIRVRNDPDGLNVKKYIYPSYNLAPWERNLSWQQLLNHSIDDPLLNAKPEERQEIIQIKPCYSSKATFWDAISNMKIMELGRLSQEAINLVTNSAPLLRGNLYNSYIDYVQEVYPVDLSYLYEIPGGLSLLPLSFFNSLINPLPIKEYPGFDMKLLGDVKWRAGCWVTGIHFNAYDRKVKLQYKYKKSGVDTEDSFDYVVCAIPFSSLRNVDVNPLFSNIKMRAIREVNYTSAQKSVLFCKERFWEKSGIIGGGSFTDLPISTIWYPSDHAKTLYSYASVQNQRQVLQSDMPGVITCSYNFDLDATRLTNLPYDMQCEEIVEEIAQVHGLPYEYLNRIVEDLKVVNWDQQPSFRGALCFFSPEQKRIFSYSMAIPEYNERIFFAGEHISAVHRWMQGALQSGMQAANDLAAACKKHKGI